MSVTTVLVPVSALEVEALLEGRQVPDLIPRATQLRRRVGRIDAIREETHGLLFERWEEQRRRSAQAGRSLLTKLFATKEPPSIPSGYDPYVHLFGRSFPVVGESPKLIVQRIVDLMKADDDRFSRAIAEDLKTLNIEAQLLYENAPTAAPDDLTSAISDRINQVATSLDANPADVRGAYRACVTLSAWSWPIWRIDGVMLPELIRVAGLTLLPARATTLFEELLETRPTLTERVEALPKGLDSFSDAGGFWSSTDVKLVAGSIRLNRSKLARNVVENADDTEATLRQLRLLEEAILFCEAENLGLAEAAGVEWHDRPVATAPIPAPAGASS